MLPIRVKLAYGGVFISCCLVLFASFITAKAYINALNRLIFKQSKSVPDKISEIQTKGV